MKETQYSIKIVDIHRGKTPGGWDCIYYRFSDRPDWCRTYGKMTPEQLDDHEKLLIGLSDGWVRVKRKA